MILGRCNGMGSRLDHSNFEIELERIESLKVDEV
jgi:hypothetical protein